MSVDHFSIVSSALIKNEFYYVKNGFKSAIKEKHEKDIKTWPAINPKTCIDYIWIKGKDVKICSANIFGNALNTDHKGVKCCLDIIDNK